MDELSLSLVSLPWSRMVFRSLLEGLPEAMFYRIPGMATLRVPMFGFRFYFRSPCNFRDKVIASDR